MRGFMRGFDNRIIAHAVIVNLKKTKFMLAGRKRRDKEISMARFALCGEELQPQVVTTSLGVAIDSQLTWKEHVKRVRQKCFVGLT